MGKRCQHAVKGKTYLIRNKTIAATDEQRLKINDGGNHNSRNVQDLQENILKSAYFCVLRPVPGQPQ